MRYARARVQQRTDFAHVYMHAMRRDDFCIEESLLLHVRDDWDSLFVAHVLNFECGFREMSMQWNIEFLCEFGSGTQDFGSTCIGRVWRNSRHYQEMILPPLNEFACHRQRILIGSR